MIQNVLVRGFVILSPYMLTLLLSQADACKILVYLGALRNSPANDFYQRHGFIQINEDEWDIYYMREAPPDQPKHSQGEIEIRLDDLSGPEIVLFLQEHIKDMKAVSPPESKHALDLEGLRKPEITFWTVWDRVTLIGCGAIKELDTKHAEVKSMRIAAAYRGQGIASMLLRHIVNQAEQRGYERLSLETGSMPFFAPARTLYEKFGFSYCAPFSTYKEDINSVFMTKELSNSARK